MQVLFNWPYNWPYIKYKMQIFDGHVQMQHWRYGLTFGCAQKMLPPGPQQAGKSGRAGG